MLHYIVSLDKESYKQSEYCHANGRDKSRPYSGVRFIGAMACLARSCMSHHFTRKEFPDTLYRTLSVEQALN
jgi:hypothetical protein